jgi:hypothetical protein
VIKVVAIVSILLPSLAFGADPAQDAAKQLELFEKSKFIWVSDFSGPVAEFQPDSDPLTVQIVVLADKSQGKSQVSADGQIIFLRASDESKSQRFIEQSFERRLKLLIART